MCLIDVLNVFSANKIDAPKLRNFKSVQYTTATSEQEADMLIFRCISTQTYFNYMTTT